MSLWLDVAGLSQFGGFHDDVVQELETRRQRKDFDFVINNAGIDRYATTDQTTEATFDALLNVHVKGVHFLTQELLPLIADGGRIVCTSTGLTRFAIPGHVAYASMKGATEAFTKYLRGG